MKSRFFVFAIVIVAMVYLLKRLWDTKEKLAATEAKLGKLQGEQAAIEQLFQEAHAHYDTFEKENPLPDDPDKKLRVAMLDAVLSADARAELGENHIDFEDEEDES